MLRLAVRRAWVQRRLLSGVVLQVALATTLLGFCSLLLDVTGPKAFSEQVQQSQPREVDVTAYVVGIAGSDLPAVRRDARSVLGEALAPLHPTLVSTATARMRRLGDAGQLGYLATTDALTDQVTLTSGRWPHTTASGPAEALAPSAAVRGLRLHLGDRLTLGGETGLDARARPVTVVIVGEFRASSRAAWESDPLSGSGFAPSYSAGTATGPAYGPFMVGRGALVASGSTVDGLRVDAHPDLSTADDAKLRSAVHTLGSASALLTGRVGSSARITRVASDLPDTLSRLHTAQSVTRSALLVVALLGTALGLAGLLLAASLVTESRVEERELLTTMGLDRGQQLTAALVEAALLAGAAAVVAVPAAVAAHVAVTHLVDFRAAGLAQGPTVSAALVETTVAAAALLTLAFVLAPLVGGTTSRLPDRRRALTRSGVDVLLLVVAVVAWWQLYSRPAGAAGDDVLLMAAPVLCLAAAAVVAVRSLPPLLAAAATAGSRSRALFPLSLHSAALRLDAGTALVLIPTAAAAAVFGVALHATWLRSQDDQADLRVGTSVSLALTSPPTAEDAASIARSVTDTTQGDGFVSPVTARPVALGSYVSRTGNAPSLVALDTRHAGDLVQGRLNQGVTWSDVGRRLAPQAPVHGVPLPAGGGGVTLVAQAPPGVQVSVTPSVVMQDEAGFRSTQDAAPVPTDGRPHPLDWSSPPGPGQRIVAVRLVFTGDDGAAADGSSMADVSVRLRVPTTGHDTVADWQVQALGPESPVTFESTSVRPTGAGATVLSVRVQLNLQYLLYTDGTVIATAFKPPSTVPVAVSQDLVDALGTKVGGELSATVAESTVRLRVVGIVTNVPSSPGRIAVLADVDTLSRARIGTGRLEPVVDQVWVSGPASRTAATGRALGALGLGTVTTRDEAATGLKRAPLPVVEPLAYTSLAVSALLLLLVGAALVVGADERARTAEVTRLRALGLPRAGARRLLLVEHAALLVPLVLAGMLVGGATALALNPSLVRAEDGTAPVPRAVIAWPWTAEILLAGGLVLACLVIAATAAAVQVRRSDTAQLRTGEWQ